jgi:S-(hydroxymethyl)glutathione dehydrogenase/alcohol dehydrogenase
MKAAVLRAVKQPLSIEDVQISKPGPHEVLIKTVAAGVCHSDLHFQTGAYLYPMPAVLGHESAGVVEQVGSEVRYVAPGDHVITCLSVFCGHCEFCLSGRPALCTKVDTRRKHTDAPRLSKDGSPVWQFLDLSSYAEQMLVHENAIVKITKDMPLDRAALIGCGVTTGVGAVLFTAKVEAGANVVVFGLGGIGLNVVQGAKMVGAAKIIGIDLNPAREALGRQFGMTHFINPKSVPNVVDAIVQATDGGADYSFECIGNTATMRQALECCHKGWGVSVIIGVAGAGQEISTRPFQLVTGRVWKGTAFGGARGRTDVPRIVDWYMEGRLKIDELITHKLPLAKINEGFGLMERGESIRSVVVY